MCFERLRQILEVCQSKILGTYSKDTKMPHNTVTLSPEEKYALITANLQEVIRGDLIREILPIRPLRIFWGSATTGRPHAAYLVPAIKLAQFLRAGCVVKVLLADIHGFLDADKALESLLEARAQYYAKGIQSYVSRRRSGPS